MDRSNNPITKETPNSFKDDSDITYLGTLPNGSEHYGPVRPGRCDPTLKNK